MKLPYIDFSIMERKRGSRIYFRMKRIRVLSRDEKSSYYTLEKVAKSYRKF